MRALLPLLALAVTALAQHADAQATFARLSDGVAFVENRGQWPDDVLFRARTAGADAWVTRDGVVFDFYAVEHAEAERDAPPDERPLDGEPQAIRRRGHVVAMRFEGGHARRAVGRGLRQAYHNYFFGSDPSKWTSRVPLYDEVVLEGLYPGVDLRLYADGGHLRYALTFAPGADVSQVRMRLEGAGTVSVTPEGALSVGTALGSVEHRGLGAYHEDAGGNRETVGSRYVAGTDGTVGFALAGADPGRQRGTDQLIWATFLGGSGNDDIETADVHPDGRVTVVGTTSSADFPVTPGAYDASYNGGGDVFVARLDLTLLPFAMTAAALNSPVPRGQLLQFNVALTNNTAAVVTGDLVFDARGPGGVGVSRVLLRGDPFPPGETRMWLFQLRVPLDAPLGAYTATVTALEGGTTPLAEATFAFGVLPSLPQILLTTEPLNSPIPRGDDLLIHNVLTNTTTVPLTFDLVLDVESQGGLVATRVLADGVALGPGETVNPTFSVRVPLSAPLGLYTATVTALEGGATALGEAAFAFRVIEQAGDAAGEDGAPWAVTLLDAGGLTGASAARAPEPEATVWPNPAARHATLGLALATPSEVRLALYDVLGREVAAVDAGRLEPGPHRLPLDVSALAAGAYVWRLTAGDRVEAGRLTVAR